MARSGRKDEFKDNVTALTSCANHYVYASAIATEIHYFSNYWNRQGLYALREDRNSQRLVDRLTDSTDNKKYTSTITQGLYSGRSKIEWRKENKAHTTIIEAKKFFSSTGASVWMQIWNGVDPTLGYRANDLKESTSVAEGFLYFFSACFECLKSTAFWNDGKLPQEFANYEDCYLELTENIQTLERSLFSRLRKIAKMDGGDLKKKTEKFQELVQEGVFASEMCVSKIEECIQNLDPTYTITYQSALILDIAALDPLQLDDILMRFWEQLPENETKTTLNLVHFPQKLNVSPFAKYGIFWGQNEPRPLDIQLGNTENKVPEIGVHPYEIFQSLRSLLSGRLYQIRGILLPHIVTSLDTPFKHNLQQNIDNNAEVFYKNVIQPFESYYEHKRLMQLVLGMDYHADTGLLAHFDGWAINTLNDGVQGAEWATSCFICSKNHISLNSGRDNLMDRVAYSQLKVSCGQDGGLGVLVRLADRVVCISCNHLFKSYSAENRAKAVSAYCSDIKFDLRPLTKISQYQSDEDVLPAEDEIIVLEPCWNGDIPVETSQLISVEDMSEVSAQGNCMCYGCIEDSLMRWVNNLHVVGPIDKGYYQIGGETEKIQSGFSGGVYVRNDSRSNCRIIGVHDGHFDDDKQVRMIPCLQ